MLHPTSSLPKVYSLTWVFSCLLGTTSSPPFLSGLKTKDILDNFFLGTEQSSCKSCLVSVSRICSPSLLKLTLSQEKWQWCEGRYCIVKKPNYETVVNYFKKIPLVNSTLKKGKIFWLHCVFSWFGKEQDFPCKNWPCASDINIAFDITGNWIRSTVYTTHVIALDNTIFLITVTSRVKYTFKLPFTSCSGYNHY